MAESTFAVGKPEIDKAVADFLGYGRTSTSWTTDQQERVDEARKSGLSDFYAAHDWTFLRPETTLTLTIDQAADDLEDDFGSLYTSFSFAADKSYAAPQITSVAKIKELISVTSSSGVPAYAAIQAKAQTGVAGSRYEVLWYPYPQEAYVMTYAYNVIRNDLTSALPYPAGGANTREAVIACCIAAADRMYNDRVGEWEARKNEKMAEAILTDSRRNAKNLGPNTDLSDGPYYRRALRYNTYNGSIGT